MNKETILKGRQKTELSEGLNVMEQMLENPDHEEELYLQSAMEELMLESDDKGLEDEGVEKDDYLSDVEEVELVEVEPVNNTQKSKKQSQITDFVVKQK